MSSTGANLALPEFVSGRSAERSAFNSVRVRCVNEFVTLTTAIQAQVASKIQ